MAHHHSHHRFCTPEVLRLVLVLVGVVLVGYIVGPPLYWNFRENLGGQASCSPCICDCSSEAMLSIPLGLVNSSFSDCGKHDRDVNEEMEKDIIDLLSEELNLQQIVTNNTLQHTRASILDARRMSSQYQKEAEKCNAGMETCEGARERAEAELIAERKLAEMWEKRARERGWKDKRRA